MSSIPGLPFAWTLGLLLLAGCGSQPPVVQAQRRPAEAKPSSRPAKARPPARMSAEPEEPVGEPAGDELPPPARRQAGGAPLADLAAQAKEHAFDLPEINDAKVAAAGIRKLAGKHLVLHTDLPEGEVDELPAVFDAAVPLWCEYFGFDAGKLTDWQVVGCLMSQKERFQGAGLLPESLPDFPNGFSLGSQLWLYDQPSAYYRRHLLLHEGTHSFMFRWLGGAGPPWYMEGIAELLATHHWQAGKLTLGIMPRSREEVPYWGRVKIIRDDLAANRGLMLSDVMQYGAHAHLRNEPYGWCWGAATFFDQHPLTQAPFRALKANVEDRTIDFSQAFYDQLKPHWEQISEDWQLFVTHCDYGYDVARAAVVHREAAPLAPGGANVAIQADRGWQSSGLLLEAGRTYEIRGQGRFEVGQEPKPWPCEAEGITLRYHAGRPLGMLLASIRGQSSTAGVTPLVSAEPIGRRATLSPSSSGVLYLCVNEAASGLADNRGSVEVEVRLAD